MTYVREGSADRELVEARLSDHGHLAPPGRGVSGPATRCEPATHARDVAPPGLRVAMPRSAEAAVAAAGGLPGGTAAAWYAGPGDCPAAAAGAEVLWLERLRAADIEAAVRAGRHLRWVLYRGAGVDRLPLPLFRERGLALVNGGGLGAVPVAEHVLMLLLAAARALPALVHAQARAEWLRDVPPPVELAGSRALLLGYGRIGRAIAERLRPFGVQVTGVRLRPAPEEPDVVGPGAWRSRLSEFDWIVVATPLTAGTRHLVGPAELAAMKPSAWLVNVARGPVVDSRGLEAALLSGGIGGACLDVTDPEPLPSDSPLWRLPNVIVTPHRAGFSPRSRERAARLLLDNLDRSLAGRPLRNLVDLDAGY